MITIHFVAEHTNRRVAEGSGQAVRKRTSFRRDPRGTTRCEPWSACSGYLTTRDRSFFGGTTEIQKEIIVRNLGL